MTPSEFRISVPAQDSKALIVVPSSIWKGALFICVGLLSVNSARAQQHPSGSLHQDSTTQLIEQMTLDEKIQELHASQQDNHGVAGVPRLNIPVFNMTNGPAGEGNGGLGHMAAGTALPAPIALAASWDVNLAYEYGSIIGSEVKSAANNMVFGPDINIARLPQNGRTFEAFGEDPYLTSEMGVAESKAIQAHGVIAEPKHYAANNQETDRVNINEMIDERTLREIYLPPWEAVVKQAQVGSIMCAYNKMNGDFACQSGTLLTQILKVEWGFTGFVNSDSGAVHDTLKAAWAGVDLEMPGHFFADPLRAAVKNRQIPMSLIDEKLYRRFSTMKRLGVFDSPNVQRVAAQPDGGKSRAIAAAGMVLLKNNGNLLPIDASHLSSIALIGPYAGSAYTGGGGSSKVIPIYTVAPLAGIQNRAGNGVHVTYAEGNDIAAAVTLAKSANVAILMLGDKEEEAVDHPITLDGNQDELADAILAANPKTIVVMKSGSAVLMPWAGKAPAILEAWYPGEEDGNAVADVLFGDVNPSGKLPLTFPARLEDLPAHTPEQYPGVDGIATYSEGIFVGYRHYDQNNIVPAFPFGYGLSYTTFSYKNLAISPGNVSFSKNASQTIKVDFDIGNTGKRAGAEVAQVYVAIPDAVVPEPPKWLKGFTKVSIPAGQTKHVQVTLDARSFAYWDVDSHGWQIAPGDYQIMIGASSRDIRLHGQIKLF